MPADPEPACTETRHKLGVRTPGTHTCRLATQNLPTTDLLQSWVVGRALPHRNLLDRFGGGLLLLAQRLHLQLDRLLQGLLGGRLALGLLALGGALVHGSGALARGSWALTWTRTGGPLLTVGNVRLLPGRGAGLGVDAWLQERSRDGHPRGEGETRIHLKACEGHR